MAAGRIVLQKAEGIARLVIDNPARMNAMSLAMWQALPDHVAEAMADPQFAQRGVFARSVTLNSGRVVPALPLPGFGLAGERPAPALGNCQLHGETIWTATTNTN